MALALGTTKAPTINRFSRLNSMAFGLAAYVSPVGCPTCGARLASRCWSGSPGRAFTRRVPTKGFPTHFWSVVLLFQASRHNPSSDVNRWMTCHGLRPRHTATHSPIRASRCWLPGKIAFGPIATTKISGLNTFTCVMADHPPSLWLHVIRYLLTCKVLF